MRYTVFTLIFGLMGTPLWAVDQSSNRVDLTATHAPALPDLGSVTLHEGTHLVNRTGRLVRAARLLPSIFYFDPDGSSPATPPMIVQQNLNLYAMESIQAGRNQPIGFVISGTVTEYKGHNYILIDQAHTTANASVASASPNAVPPRSRVAATVQPVGKEESATRSTSTAPSLDATPNDTMVRLLAPPAVSDDPLPPASLNNFPSVDRTSGPAAVAPAATTQSVIREGTHLINRTGRLSHSADGKDAVFTFDTDGKAMKDPPMFVLPNQKLQTMEDSNKNLSKDAHFRVSGTITEYKGRNYIELDKAVMMADVEVQF